MAQNRVALDFINKPDSNSGTERFFNPFRIIHSWARNRMGEDMLDTMVYIYVQERCLKRLNVLKLN